MNTFETKQEAFDWLETEFAEDYINNLRFAYVDDESAMNSYEVIKDSGCCGDYDIRVVVGGREALIGCNYGH